VIRVANPKAATPEWMKRRIERCGVRSISALVDITNYVMLELGQPLHAFDDATLNGAITVRWARQGETLLLLNGQTLTLASDELVIADESGPLALAGIMGGEQSGVTDSTTDVFLESAFFAPAAIAGRARRYGFASDASHRFERGVDFQLAPRAIERASELILAISGGELGPVVEACAELPQRPPVCLRVSRAHRVLGIELGAERIAQLLASLDLSFTQDGDSFVVTPPSHRFDLEIEEDLIEELARLYGYDNIPAPAPKARLSMLPLPENQRDAMSVRRLVAGRDFQEVVNFAFVEASWERDFCANTQPIRLANPIASQMGVMRSSLLGGLIANVQTNRKRQQNRVRVFEIGRCFTATTVADSQVPGYQQSLRLAALAAGPVAAEQWGISTQSVDFFDLKADLEALLAPQVAAFERLQHPALHPGRAAQVILNGEAIGWIGEIHPNWVQAYDLGSAPVAFELELAPLLAQSVPVYREVSRYPAVVRDLALVVDQAQAVAPLLAGLKQVAAKIVTEIELFDKYQGKGVAEGCKSLAFRVTMQDTCRTLEEAEVEAAMAGLMAHAEQALGAKLRS
jgi:phenylalanyl-tRNA synthetase beta chain